MGERLKDLTLDGLAVYRLTRLVTTDRISEPLRDRLVGHPVLGFVGEGIECDWCVSVWMGAVVAAGRRWAPELWGVARWGLTLSVVTGLLSDELRRRAVYDAY
jgi:hypothetical protein